MRWLESWRFDSRALPLADRHYSRQQPGTPQFVPPGRCVVLITPPADALWVTSSQEYATHAWPGAWVCSLFRNESEHLSSELILEAVAATRWTLGEPPEQGMVTFVNPAAIRPKPHPGMCFRIAGFKEVGRTQERDYVVLQLPPESMPAPEAPIGAQHELFP